MRMWDEKPWRYDPCNELIEHDASDVTRILSKDDRPGHAAGLTMEEASANDGIDAMDGLHAVAVPATGLCSSLPMGPEPKMLAFEPSPSVGDSTGLLVHAKQWLRHFLWI
jgi:hypothetical protein